MSRQAKIIIFGIILAYSLYSHQNDSSIFDWAMKTREANKKKSENFRNKYFENKNNNTKEDETTNSKKNNSIANKKPKIKLIYPKEPTIKKGNVTFIGEYSYSTNLTSKRVMSRTLYSDSKNIGESILEVKKSDNPTVYVVKRGLFTSLVVLDYGNKIFYKGYILNTTLIDPPNIQNKNSVVSSKEKFDIESNDYMTIPSTGSSPYDKYFGKGIYNETENYIEVTASEKTHVVFVLINTLTKKRIRNEFIRKGETYRMTKIPYGTYDYMYFTGRNWSNELTINKGKVKGAFKDYQSFNKNKFNSDQMEFKNGYYGGFTIKLVQTIGGNLETKSTSEDNFFN